MAWLKENMIALAALVLAATSAVIQLGFWFYGESVKLKTPDFILLDVTGILAEHHSPGETEREMLRASSNLLMANDGAVGYDAIIEKTFLEVSIGEDIVTTLTGHDIVYTAGIGATLKAPSIIEAWQPVTLAAKSGFGNEVVYVPYPKSCIAGESDCKPTGNWVGRGQFVNAVLGASSEGTSTALKIKITVEQFDGTVTQALCQSLITDEFIASLVIDGIASVLCQAE